MRPAAMRAVSFLRLAQFPRDEEPVVLFSFGLSFLTRPGYIDCEGVS